MKRILIVLLVFMLLLSLSGFAVAAFKGERDSTREELRTIIALILMPEIQKVVDAFYTPYLSVLPRADATFARVENIVTSPNNTGYTVVIETEPYVGAHVSVGRDRVTLKISASGAISVIRFEHLNSYPLPPHLKSLLRNPLP